LGLLPDRFFDSLGSKLKKNFYRILGVNQKADPESLKKAYRKAAKRYHPDISPKDEEKFKEVQEAYETLSDSRKKAIYDQQVLERPASEIRHHSPRPSAPIYSPFNFFDDIDELFANFECTWSHEKARKSE
jgi:DnaJ-class molecular chaperone